MEKFFSIGRTARLANVTTETLRHYDRIGLVRPSKTDEWTGYRYYTDSDIVRLHTVRALRCMDLSLEEIKRVLELDDMDAVVGVLNRATDNADRKIAELNEAKARIERAKLYYKSKTIRPSGGQVVRMLPERVILLSDDLRAPTVDNLWDYHRHFYAQVGDRAAEFSFEDLAGLYETDEGSRMFAVCERYADADGLTVLPAGRYLCADCAADGRERAAADLRAAAERFGTHPTFVVYIVVLTGILQWKYEVQVYIG